MEGDRSLLGRRRFLAIAGAGRPPSARSPAGRGPRRPRTGSTRSSPSARHDFGTVARGSILRHSFRVENRTNQPIHITRLEGEVRLHRGRGRRPTIPPGAQTTIEAVLDTTSFQRLQGVGAHALTSTGRPSGRSSCDLSCFIQDEVVVQPGTRRLRRGPPRGRGPEVILGLEYRGTRPDWRVVEMRTISGAVKARLEEIARDPAGTVRYRLVATLDPANLRNGDFRDEIRLRTNDPERRQIPLSVSAKVTSEVALSPAVLNLGDVQAGRAGRADGPDPRPVAVPGHRGHGEGRRDRPGRRAGRGRRAAAGPQAPGRPDRPERGRRPSRDPRDRHRPARRAAGPADRLRQRPPLSGPTAGRLRLTGPPSLPILSPSTVAGTPTHGRPAPPAKPPR